MKKKFDFKREFPVSKLMKRNASNCMHACIFLDSVSTRRRGQCSPDGAATVRPALMRERAWQDKPP